MLRLLHPEPFTSGRGIAMNKTRQLMSLCIVFCLVTIMLGQSGQPPGITRDEEFLQRQVSITLTGQEGTIESAFMRVMADAKAPGGIVTVSRCNEEAKYRFGENTTSLREALDAIVYSDPTNKWENKNGVVNLIPVSNMPALLELRIAEFHVENAKTVLHALDHLLKLPEVRQRIAQLHLEELSREPGLTDLKRPGFITPDPPGLNVHCRKTTFRGVLNAIARAHGSAIWSYTERHCSGGRDEIRLDFLSR
jgi:hypothetical protein